MGTSNGRLHSSARIFFCFLTLVTVACSSQSLTPSGPLPSCDNPAPLDASAASEGTEMRTYLIALKGKVSVDHFAERVAAEDVLISSKMNAVGIVAVSASSAAVARLRCDVEVQSISMDEPTIAN